MGLKIEICKICRLMVENRNLYWVGWVVGVDGIGLLELGWASTVWRGGDG